ncbi:MAG: hypothetical protein VCA38_00570, partial [Roseibacillus sp.]
MLPPNDSPHEFAPPIQVANSGVCNRLGQSGEQNMAEFPSADGGSCAEIPHVGAFNIGGVVRVLLCA